MASANDLRRGQAIDYNGDISVVLERALFDHRYWLPFRQEIEIRRRTAWLDFPFRTVIRGRWDIGDYELEAPLPRGVSTIWPCSLRSR